MEKTRDVIQNEDEIQKKQKSVEDLKIRLTELTAEFRKNQEELNRQIYVQGKDQFCDIKLEDLLVVGEVVHTEQIGEVGYSLKTLTKAESLYIDKVSKKYIGETPEFYNNSIQVAILAFSLKEYNKVKAPELNIGTKSFEENFNTALSAVTMIAEPVLDKIFFTYNKMTRWIRAALEINLKN